MQFIAFLLLFSFLELLPGIAPAQAGPSLSSTPVVPTVATSTAGLMSAVPPGTVINSQNWQIYRTFMPAGMADLFAGQYFWRMPPDAQMDVGRTVIHPLPPKYMEATEKYSGQVQVVTLPGGGLTLSNYQGGIPFPEPSEPNAGWKVLADLWFRYLPHLSVDTNGVVCAIDSRIEISCKAGVKVYRQLSYNTDPGVPSTIPGAEGKFFTQYETVKEPEQERYTTVLTISYSDLTRPEDVYVFMPTLRRSLRTSPSARCSADLGTDETPDDRRYGFNMNLTRINAQLVREKQILALMNYSMPSGRFPQEYDLPLGWPKSHWGNWQLREVYVVNVTNLPGESNKCLGQRILYIDKATYAPLWEDLYDADMKPWRFIGFFLHALDIPRIGPVDTSNSMVYGFWDVKYSHATIFAEAAEGQPFYINDQAPKEFLDLEKYTTAGGLDLIMR
jgi:hypothetical protein